MTSPTTATGEVTSEEPVPTAEPATIGIGLVLTAVAWILTRVVVGSAWAGARNPLVVLPTVWDRWDSGNYLFIAAHGRNLGQCGSPGYPTLFPQLKGTWCGHAGWLPGYPWLVHVVHWTGISLAGAGLLVSWMALAVALYLVWFGWLRALPATRALAVLLLLGLFPGAVYNLAIFPTSVALACLVGALVAATRQRFLAGALLMTAAGLCYPTAWFAAAGLAVGLVLIALPLGAGQIVRRGLWGVAGLGSLVVLGVHDQVALGHANAYLLVQTGTGLNPTPFPGQIYLPHWGRDLLVFQCIASICLGTAAAVVAGLRWLKDRGAAFDLYPALAGVAVILGLWLFAQDHAGAWNRSIALAAPCVVCFRRLPQPVLWVMVAVVGTTTALLSHYFFTTQLI